MRVSVNGPRNGDSMGTIPNAMANEFQLRGRVLYNERGRHVWKRYSTSMRHWLYGQTGVSGAHLSYGHNGKI